MSKYKRSKKTQGINCFIAMSIAGSALFLIQPSTASITPATTATVQQATSVSVPQSYQSSSANIPDGLSTAFNSNAGDSNFMAVSQAESKAAQSIQTNIESCANNGIGAVVRENLDLQMTVWGRPIDVNRIFSPESQGGCFVDIGRILDLSSTIPSPSSIINAAQQMLIDYATRKACDAMKSASAEIVGPINDVIGEINKAGQYTDVSGALGEVLNKELNKIDEGLVLPSGAFEGKPYPIYSNSNDQSNTTGSGNAAVSGNTANTASQNQDNSFANTVRGFFSN